MLRYVKFFITSGASVNPLVGYGLVTCKLTCCGFYKQRTPRYGQPVDKFYENKWEKMWGIVGEYVFLHLICIIRWKMQFLGTIDARLDAKGRVFIPVSFRRFLQNGKAECLVLRKDIYENCLTLYPEAVWNKQLAELRGKLNRWNAAHQRLYRQFVSDVELVGMDANGRILIPKRSLKSCGINQDVRFIGMGDTLEIWPLEQAQEPFLDVETFGCELERIMNIEQPEK